MLAVTSLAPASDLAVVVDDLGTTLAGVVAVVCCLVARRRAGDRRTWWAWGLVGASATAWTVANIHWTWYELVLDQPVPFPSPFEAFFLSVVPLAVAGGVALGPPLRSEAWTVRLIDVAINVVAITGLVWLMVLPSGLADELGGLDLLLAHAYPIGDVLLLSLVWSLITAADPRPRWLALLALGASTLAVADLTFIRLESVDAYRSGTPVAVLWAAGFLALALAALAHDGPLRIGPVREDLVSRLARHLAPVVVLGVLLAEGFLDDGLTPAALGLVVVIVVLRTVRLDLVANQNRVLAAALAERVRDLQTEHERASRVIDEARDPYVELDAEGRIVVWNGPAEEVFGWRAREVIGLRMIETMVPADNRPAARERLDHFMATGDASVWDEGADVRYLRPDGSEVHAEIAAWTTGTGEDYRVHGFIWDISERLAQQEAIEARERYWRAVVRHSSDLTLLLDADGHILHVLPTARTIPGWDGAEDEAAPFTTRCHPDDLAAMADEWTTLLATPGEHRWSRFRVRGDDGRWVHVEGVATNLIDDPAVGAVVIALRDVTAQVRAEREAERHLHEDGLTGLPNRTVMLTAVEAALGELDGVGAFLLLDLDDFKDVNDGLGHDVGDRLLTEVADRLRHATRGTDVVARLGGDEFGVLVTGIASLDDARAVADHLAAAVGRPVALDEATIHVSVSIGVTELHPGDSARAVVQRADVAMYRAKRTADTVAVYGERDDEERRRTLQVAMELRSAVEADELELHFQPKIELGTGLVDSVEALVRWEHPVRGLLGPDEFIPLAERTGVIAEVTAWVLDAALAQCAVWRAEGLDLPVAVNLSPKVLSHPDVVTWVRRALGDSGLPASRLTLEVTESAFLGSTPTLRNALDQLADLGTRLSVDDFGTGYSSLSNLKALRVNELKIDRSFVDGLGADPTDSAIVRSVIDLGRSLGLTIVAEGVESAEVAEALVRLGCHLGQGFWWSRPVPGPRLTGWILDRAADRQAVAGDRHPPSRQPPV